MKDFFGGLFAERSEITDKDLNSPFSLKISQDAFCKTKTNILYKRILSRCYSRSDGAQDSPKILSLFDSTERSNSSDGLISLLATAMTLKQEIAIIYKVGVVRIANHDEKEQIKKDYKQKAKSELGVLVDFKNYYLTDLVMSYMAMIHDVLNSMNTQVGLAKSLQIKISNLRGTVSAVGKDDPIQQAKDINEALKSGRSVLLDKNDIVETLKLDSSSVEAGVKFVNSLLATDLGVSLSFVNGELTSGMSATGEADANQDEYGFQDFFNSILKPVCDKLYGWNLIFVTDDWRYSSSLIDKLIIVENSSILSPEQKLAYAQRAVPIGKK